MHTAAAARGCSICRIHHPLLLSVVPLRGDFLFDAALLLLAVQCCLWWCNNCKLVARRCNTLALLCKAALRMVVRQPQSLCLRLLFTVSPHSVMQGMQLALPGTDLRGTVMVQNGAANASY